VHAVLFDADYAIPPPREAGTAFERFAKRAACGARVKVIFPMAFDTEEPDACPRCRFTCNFTGENRFDSTPRFVPRATGILRHCPTAA
jgi:hypothetical protein